MQLSGPVGEAEFAQRMAAFAPFEAQPRIAAAVSGGRDSLALTLLLDRWARAGGGSVLALTVDHGLRPESGAEAAQVGRWLRDRGIDHHILAWTGPKPATGLQEAARQARYRLLESCCREEGVLHLALGHQREDQAETVLIRREDASGPDGLAAMPSVRETPWLRLLRPLLDVPRARLAATCKAFGQPWIDDPSNRADRFARPRLRAASSAPDAADLALAAREAGLVRAAADMDVADLLAAHATFHPEGWVELSPDALADAAPDVAARMLARLLTAVAGRPYPPRSERLARLVGALRAGRGQASSLGGCLIRPGPRIRILREPAAMDPPVFVAPQGTATWDGRFRLTWHARGEAELGALENQGWAEIAGRAPHLRRCTLPAAVRRTLPAVRQVGTVVAVPHLNYVRPDRGVVRCDLTAEAAVPVAAPRFSVVTPVGEII